MELLDINGLYIWDNTIFDNMVIPSDINRAELIDMILYECRELTITVISPTIIKRAIHLWSTKNIYYWNELQKTMHYTYNPIENYDRHEKTTDKYKNNQLAHETGTRTNNQNGVDKTTHNGTSTSTQSGSKTTTDELTVSAYNDNVLQPRETHTITETPTDYATTTTPNLTDVTDHNLHNVETPDITNDIKGDGDNTHESYVHGNIGVMSTQQMITAQREVIDISLYNIIVNSFKNEFCILKY